MVMIFSRRKSGQWTHRNLHIYKIELYLVIIVNISKLHMKICQSVLLNKEASF